ncbi:ABC transporter substrate-binding protein [Brachyspira hampsonii]|uniref:Sugar ABC transporter substrate-binding protein n=1 Tax=Brachyspira hampsonii TaxID=1287055 RepID=A0AAC9XJG9_9SPIR|nr:ABC transporter substrate-binding protein [Brachyspira hampsonii]ASJ20565.1 sugar ABC transporter substrate-binding protein [Brachyspira hampsonii]ELV05962.1 ABC transporter substrate-binding protein [Brachyspira hampsonii 30599]MBW5381195.1 ABC transporter substrate-binding protein [Brachyspira hampsonii]MBW5409778.1 ABC transporter substrate-binding protein [Brachyspira hampsonii]OEJ18345.1 sugar ABC transporter substrate-binding protein [Brachyspira hampsonii]
MKKLFIALSISILLIASCSKTNDANTSSNNESKKIGILQLVEHTALDQANKGFVDGLKEAGYEDGKNIIIDYQNAQGEQANCITISQKFINDRVDLILAIATPAAQAVANLTKDIPILITAVTDPADSKLVADNNAPGGNVTGTSDLTPVKEQMDLLKKLVPSAQKIAFLYNSSEQNSKFQVDIAKEKADELGLSYVDATITNPNDIQQVVQSLVGKVDAIYVPTDNMVSAGMANVVSITEPAKIPVICGEAGMLNAGGLATYGIDYYELGKLTANQAVKILKGESQPANMPIEYIQNPVLEVNTNAAQKLGVTIPADL